MSDSKLPPELKLMKQEKSLVRTCAVAASGGSEDMLLFHSSFTQCPLKPGQLVDCTLLLLCPGWVAGVPMGTRYSWLSAAAARLREACATQEGREPLTLAFLFIYHAVVTIGWCTIETGPVRTYGIKCDNSSIYY